MADVQRPPVGGYSVSVETLIIGGGACGLVAALAAQEAGQEVLVIEADPVPHGSTALSAGLIPAAGTAIQSAAGIEDDPATFAGDIRRKAHSENDPVLEQALAHGASQVIDWLSQTHTLPFSVVTDFDYPGHSKRRMHGLPSRSGADLLNALRAACERQDIQIAGNLRAETLYSDARRITGLAARRPDGEVETIGCRKLILACNGFGGNRQMVGRLLPEIADAVWFGHDGNKGEAVEWGRALGADLRHLGAYQGHGNVAHPHGILITWAVMTEGGVQVNLNGERFWDESQGYSEAARAVLTQPQGAAFAIFDTRIEAVARQFADYREAETQGVVLHADTIADLALVTGVPKDRLAETLAAIPKGGTDRFGRRFGDTGLQPPYRAVRVTGALFHTQGGLRTDGNGRVYHGDGTLFPNLYAAGGAACGVSGSGDSGYLSGNGLLSAVVLGHNAGRSTDY